MIPENSSRLLRELKDADAFVAWTITHAELAAAPRLKWFQSIGTGVDGVPLEEFSQRGIRLTNNSGVCAPNIAEHVLSMMLAFARQLPRLIRGQLLHEWRDDSTRAHVFELNGQAALFVGLGDIGLACAERAHAIGMRVLGVRRHSDRPHPAAIDEVGTVDQLGEMLPQADHVVICLPLTARTDRLFDDTMIKQMRPSSYLYNIGRGAIIDSTALIEALRSGRIAGAGLDVTDPEPLPPESPLWGMDNVLVTCHTSGGTPRHWERAAAILMTNVSRFDAGQQLINVVDLEEGY